MSRVKRWHRTLPILGILTLVVACADDDVTVPVPPAEVDNIVLSVNGGPPERASVLVGDSMVVTALALDVLGNPIPEADFTWVSAFPSVARVSGGLVTGLRAGTTVVSAVADSEIASVTVDVMPRPTGPGGPPTLGTLTVSPGSVTLTAAGQTAQMAVTAIDSLGNEIASPAVTWSSSNEAVATVSGSGLVTLRSFGIATISAVAACCLGDVAQVIGQAPSQPGDAQVLFAADWNTALGRSTAALTDGGALVEYGYPASLLLEVIDLGTFSLPASWPQRGLEISFGNQAASLVGTPEGVGGWPAPAIGETLYFRMLAYNALPANSGVTFEHGMQSNVGQIAHGWQFFSPEGGNNFQLGFFSLSGGFSNYFASVPANRPLRLEWALTRTGAAEASLEIRIYDESVSSTASGWGLSDFLGNWGQGPQTLATAAAGFSVVDQMSGFRSYTFGASGSSAPVASGLIITGFAVCSDDWCGPYSPGEGG